VLENETETLRKEMIEILEIWEMGFVIKAEFIIITPVCSVT